MLAKDAAAGSLKGSPQLRFTDRSRTELDFTCPRARYWAYEYDGLGLAPQETPKELAFGIGIADELAKLKAGQPWSTEAFSGEEQLLAHALLYGYERSVWPRWLRDYDLVAIEQEQPKLLAPWLTYNSRPDTLMRRKSDGTLWYGPEDKTTSWVDSLLTYTNNVQLHATALCVEDHHGSVAGCLVQGLYKGFVKEGKLFHPLVYAYRKDGIPGITPDQWSVKWVRGWERAPVSEYPGGIEGWIRFLEKKAPETFEGVFPTTPPVMVRRDLAEAYLEQVLIRESTIEVWRQQGSPKGALKVVFPQAFSQCDQFSRGRRACTFKDLCWSATAAKFPLSLYRYRESHHTNEREALSANDGKDR